MAVQRSTHPSADLLKAFGLGKLDDSSSGMVMDHLDQCQECRNKVAALSGDNFLHRLRQAHSRSGTPAPAKSLAEVAHAEKPAADRTPIPNLPPELANNPHYEILRELGRGGMGVVYLAHNKLMDRLEVLKVVNKALLDHPGAVERFLREIRAAAKLNHANVVAAYSAVQQGELLAFAMEYVEGQDLASLVKSQGPLPVVNACFYVQQAASGLHHAYEKQMVHRDIKPQNLILTREGKKHTVKVLDFGLAKVLREKTDDTGLTGEGRMLGTPDYIAPEQTLDAAKADIRADIYSLGCTLYYLLSGRPPFSATSLGAILLAHQMQEAKPLNLVREEVPEALAAIVRKMMAKSPAQRYQTPREVVQALAPFIKPGAAPRSSPELSVGPAEPKPAVKKAAQVDSLPVPPQPPDVEEAPPKRGMFSDESRRSGRFSDLTIGSQLGQSIPNVAPRKKKVRKRRPAGGMTAAWKKWLIGGGIGVGMLLLALLGLWAGGVFKAKVKTADGEAFLVVKNLPADAAVLVDGQTIAVNFPGDNQPVEIRVRPGRRQLEVKKGGFKVFSETIELQAAEKSNPIQVTLEPLQPKTEPSEYVNALGMKFRLIPPGTFLMGSTPSEIERCIHLKLPWPPAQQFESEGPAHEVEITQPFYIGIHEVTVGQFRQFVKAMDYKTQAEKEGGARRLSPNGDWQIDGATNWRNPGFEQTDDHPVVCVSWNDAVAFCAWLSGKEGRKYRLPSEAEWEYCCRAKTTTRFCCGDDENRLKEFANLRDVSTQEKWPRYPLPGVAWDDGYPCTAPVGHFQANAFGLHDMHGNVAEWCADWYDKDYYKNSPKQDPPGPNAGTERVVRGSGWTGVPTYCRSSFRSPYPPSSGHNLGFRVVLLTAQREAKAAAPSPSSEPAAQVNPPPQRPPETWLERVKSLPVERVPDAIADRLRELNPGFDGKIKYAIENGQVVSLEFGADAVRDISPVQALPGLRKLHCRGSWFRKGKIADLRPLQGLKLTELFCDGNPQVTDLSPLRGMPLTRLFCAGTEVTDLSPLKGMNLMELDCGYGSLSDLSPLKEVKLTRLHLYHSRATDASLIALQQVPGLRNLEIAGEGITDAGLAHISKIPDLEHFEYGRAKFTGRGLVHLKGMTKLRHLKVFDAPVKDQALVHVKGMVGLREFGFDGTQVGDAGLAHLTGLKNLVWLDLRRTRVTDKGVAKLQAALPKCRMIR